MSQYSFTYSNSSWNWTGTVKINYAASYDETSNKSTLVFDPCSISYFGRKLYGTTTKVEVTAYPKDAPSNAKTSTLSITGTTNGGIKEFTGALSPTSVVLEHSSGSVEKNVVISVAVSTTVYPASNSTTQLTVSGNGSTTVLTGQASISQISGSAGTLGVAHTLTVTRYSTAVTHTITATCGTESLVIVKNSTDSQVTWTPPASWASQNASATSVAVSIVCETYNGGTRVGSSSISLTFGIPDSAAPNVTLEISDSKGYVDIYGAYVQGQSKVQCSVSAVEAYGASILSYSISCGSQFISKQSGTLDILDAGLITITASATDSRGRTGSVSKQISVLAYSRPTLSILSQYRCDESGVESDLGNHGIAFFSAEVDTLGGNNTASFTFKYRAQGSDGWTTIALSNLNGIFSIDRAQQIFPADIDSAYDICISAKDNFGPLDSMYRTLPIARPLADFNRDLRAIGIGARAVEKDTVTFGVFAQFGAGTSLMRESDDYPGCYYRKVDDEIEWLNPPMMPGLAYRTAERINGKPVYMKYIQCGAAPDCSSVYVAHEISNPCVIAFGGFLYINAGALALPRSGVAALDVDAKNITLTTTTDASSYTFDVWIKYI